MRGNHGRRTAIIRTLGAAALAACIAVGCLLSGCGGSQVDKYTVTDADRKAAQPALGPDGKPLQGGTASLPRDPNDKAAYGPDGKPMSGH
jgi:hypothetical protein